MLGGELTTLAELVRRVAAIAGPAAAAAVTPTWALRAAAPLVRRIGPDLGEIVSASAGRHLLGHRREGARASSATRRVTSSRV